MLYPQLQMEINIVILTDLDMLNILLNLIDPPQKQSLMIILGILDNTPGKIDPIDFMIIIFECFEFIGVYLFHYLQPEVY